MRAFYPLFSDSKTIHLVYPCLSSIYLNYTTDLQINKVDPVMDEQRLKMPAKAIDEQILRYYRVNDVQKFRYSRPFHREPRDLENEFASLWVARTVLVTSYPLPGILRWFPVTAADTYHLSPLQNAIETMETANKSLREMIIAHTNDMQLSFNPLSMKLSGMVDPAVMGGVMNYEKVCICLFFRLF